MEQFDFVTLIFLCIAVVVFLKLLSVLGTRTGHEKPPSPPYSGRAGEKKTPLPFVADAARGDQSSKEQEDALVESTRDMIERFAGDNAELTQQLQKIAEKDRLFDLEKFIAGAEAAYEEVLELFADGDAAGLRQLVDKSVLERMKSALDGFKRQKQTVEFQLIGVSESNITSAALAGTKMNIVVTFVADVIMVVLDEEGRVVSGHPKRIQKRCDRWTFERSYRSKNPAWWVVRTESVNAA